MAIIRLDQKQRMCALIDHFCPVLWHVGIGFLWGLWKLEHYQLPYLCQITKRIEGGGKPKVYSRCWIAFYGTLVWYKSMTNQTLWIGADSFMFYYKLLATLIPNFSAPQTVELLEAFKTLFSKRFLPYCGYHAFLSSKKPSMN